jgi:hypothetical protein
VDDVSQSHLRETEESGSVTYNFFSQFQPVTFFAYLISTMLDVVPEMITTSSLAPLLVARPTTEVQRSSTYRLRLSRYQHPPHDSLLNEVSKPRLSIGRRFDAGELLVRRPTTA